MSTSCPGSFRPPPDLDGKVDICAPDAPLLWVVAPPPTDSAPPELSTTRSAADDEKALMAALVAARIPMY